MLIATVIENIKKHKVFGNRRRLFENIISLVANAEIASRLSNIQMVEIEPYHCLGEVKLEGLGKEVNTFKTPTADTVEGWVAEISSTCNCPVAQNA